MAQYHGARLVTAATVGALALTLVGCGSDPTASGANPSTGPVATVDTSPTATPAADPTTPPVPAFGPIPDHAFVTPPTNPSSQKPEESGDYPAFCGKRYASDSAIGVRRTRTIAFHSPEAPEGYVPSGTVNHTITVYRSGGAARALAELRAAVTACPTETDGATTYTHAVVSAPKRGDGSVLVKVTGASSQIPIGYSAYVSVVRLGDVVSVLFAVGWEGATVERAQIDSFTQQAVRRITAWRG
jgi:hypothetical protein